jgi:FeS assembly protein IscX
LKSEPASAGGTHEELMPKDLTWDDAEDIGIELSEKFPEQNPLEVRFTDLHKFVIELANFSADPKASNEGKLEAIQMAWYEEYQDRQD